MRSDKMPEATYRFGRFTLDTARGLLLGSDGAVALRPKSFALLQLLARNPDRLLSHDEIASMVWPETTVTDESIVQCVRDIRRALGAGADELIRTLPRRGYMLVSAIPLRQPQTGPCWKCSR